MKSRGYIKGLYKGIQKKAGPEKGQADPEKGRALKQILPFILAFALTAITPAPPTSVTPFQYLTICKSALINWNCTKIDTIKLLQSGYNHMIFIKSLH